MQVQPLLNPLIESYFKPTQLPCIEQCHLDIVELVGNQIINLIRKIVSRHLDVISADA